MQLQLRNRQLFQVYFCSGGYFDSGDYVKFNFPMAFTTTVLSWGLIQYADAYKHVGEMDNCMKAIKWATDYFIKCHVEKNVLYGQVKILY